VEIAEIDSAYDQIDSLAERAAYSPSTLTAGLFGVFSCPASGSAPAKDAFVDPSECSNLSSQQQYSGCEALATPFSDPLSAVQEDADYSINDLQSPMVSTPRMCLQSQSLPRTHQYLLHHYANRVADIFCIIDNPSSPWHTIHLPKAMQTAGELSITGKTSRIRHALLTAILATSAFILAHDQIGNSSGLDDWETMAISLRHQAICLLKQAVDEEFYSTQKPKYKDFLVSMLTMVTIDVGQPFASICRLLTNSLSRSCQETPARAPSTCTAANS
jgi:arginine metabolism regulation protein II